MAKKDTWEIDVEKLTLNDLILLEEGGKSLERARDVREVLGRLVTNKTAEEIGEIPLGELWEHLEAVSEAIKDTVPKSSGTPS